MSRAVQTVFENYRIQRHGFAQSLSDFSSRPEYAQQIIQQGGIILLRNLLTDTSPAIQQNACLAVGRLSSHDPNIAAIMIKQDIVRILLYFNMDKSNKYLKRAALMAIRNVVRHSSDLSRCVMDIGGLDQIVASLSDFDPGVKEAAGWVCSSIAKHDTECAHAVIGAGAVPLLILCLQEPEVIVRSVAANALSEISKHSPETSQTVIDSGAITHLVRGMSNVDSKLKRQAMNGLASIAKQSMDMAEVIIEADVVQTVLEHCGHTDEGVRKSACGLVREIVKHSPELAQLIVAAGGLGVIVNAIVRNRGDTKLPGIMALGFIAGHTPALALSVVYSKGTDALSVALTESEDSNVAAAAAWAMGHIARHSSEHAKYVSTCGVLPRILEIYMSPSSTEEMKDKAKQALKMILLRTDDLENVESLLTLAPPNILKYVVAQYSKVLPRDPAARRAFVTTGGLRKLQELLTSESAASEGSILREHILLINQCFPEDVVKYFSPDYPQTLLERVEQFQPTLNIDPALWSEKLFSDTNIPPELKEEILALQAQFGKSKVASPSKTENVEAGVAGPGSKVVSTNPSMKQVPSKKGSKISGPTSVSGSKAKGKK